MITAYASAREAIQNSRSRLDTLPCQTAARETFLIGQSAIRLLNLDPLLPKEIIDTALLDHLHQDMIAYDKLGRKIWLPMLRGWAKDG